MKKISLVIAMLALIICAGCKSDGSNANTKIFIEDSENPGLPVVSEWGYGYFGAYFYQNDVKMVFKGINFNNTVSEKDYQITFVGAITGENVSSYSSTLEVILKNAVNGDAVNDLNGKEFDLSDANVCTVNIDYNNVTVKDGKLKFNRVNNVVTDGKVEEYKLYCGEFNMTVTDSIGKEIRFEKGRFDKFSNN